MTPERSARANRSMLVVAFLLLIGAYLYGQWAWAWLSWRAVGFAICASVSVLCLASAVLLLWVATSVDAVDPSGQSEGTPATRV